MTTVKQGDRIRICYEGKFDDGTVFDSSDKDKPLELTVGNGEFLKPLEEGVVGMSPGETKTIPAGEAYGPHNEDMVFEFDRKKAPPHFDPVVGQQVQMHRADGMPVSVTVVAISEQSFTMDCNHPLAGKNLTFHVTLQEIV